MGIHIGITRNAPANEHVAHTKKRLHIQPVLLLRAKKAITDASMEELLKRKNLVTLSTWNGFEESRIRPKESVATKKSSSVSPQKPSFYAIFATDCKARFNLDSNWTPSISVPGQAAM
ncbi:hypothetical protein EVAR_57159_1 [Eumeta japonica]|uniref:Uncharacterized protein n=1 Tax=Eumeta variegata TaxID=151549 RepID=A0A4C1YQ63_EUMVA|nr:hypothetical protein EVAR_57159_1 [Eumeta japonica]